MAFLDTPELATRHSPFGLNRGDVLGGAFNAVLPIAALILFNGLAAPDSWQASSELLATRHLAPPDWLAAIAWMTIYPALGVARWTAWQAGEAGQRASWWVVALLIAALAFPFASSMLDVFWLSTAQIGLLLLAVITAGKLFQVSRKALLWMLPALLWLGALGVLAFTAVASGWSPGFPATQTGPQSS